MAYSFDFIKDWPDEEKNHYKKKLIDILDLDQPIEKVKPKPEGEEIQEEGK